MPDELDAMIDVQPTRQISQKDEGPLEDADEYQLVGCGVIGVDRGRQLGNPSRDLALADQCFRHAAIVAHLLIRRRCGVS